MREIEFETQAVSQVITEEVITKTKTVVNLDVLKPGLYLESITGKIEIRRI